MKLEEMKNKIVCMNCMDLMALMPDKYIDLAIIDPEYGIGEDGKKNHSRGSNAGANKFKNSRNTTGVGIPSTIFKIKDWDSKPPDKEYFDELIRVSKNQIIWGANHFVSRIPYDSSCWIVWDKVNGETDFADCELAWTSFKTSVRMFKFMWNGMLQGNMKEKEKRIHPTQKPIALGRWLLQKYAKPGDLILDTHNGSGTFACSAWLENYEFYACEKDVDYHKESVDRFETLTSQGRLF